MYAETFDQNIEDKVVEIYPDGSESSSSDSERQIDVITGDESGENNSLDTHIKETKSLSSSASGRKSSSFSLSEISSDDLFGIDTLKFATSDAPAPKSEKNYVSSSDESSAKSEKNLSSNDFFGIDNLKFTASNASEPAPKSGKNYVSSSDESSSNSETNNRPPVPTSTYQVYNVAYSPKCMSPTLSPSIQVMDRSGGYDSSRIPSSIFEINSNINPLEWSLASNDSLFSIHIDQNSFSKDTFKFRESQRSEKLTKPVEQNTFNQIPSVTIEKIDISNKIDDIENLEPLEESFRFKPHLTEVQHDIKSLHEIVNSMSTKSSAMSSFENETMRHSFVPLKKRSRQFFNCCNCSFGFCYHKRPTCWPSCNCSCGWLFCSCCNSSPSTPILAETDGNSFEKRDDTPGQESYKEGSETTSIHSKHACNSCNWFHCFTRPTCICNLSCARCKYCC